MEKSIENLPKANQELTSLENTNQRPSPWQRLPTELVQCIVEQHTLIPSSRKDSNKSQYPVDAGLPDLTLMKVNHQSRAIFEEIVLPAIVVIEIWYHSCECCRSIFGSTSEADLSKIFSATDSQPWSYLFSKASLISIDVKCKWKGCGKQTPISTTATVYHAGQSLNVLALSQLVMITIGNARREFEIRCTPRSIKGARESINFLKDFAGLMPGVTINKSALDGLLTHLPRGVYPDGLKLIVDQIRRERETWTDTAVPAKDAFLAGSQRLIDEGKVPIHQIAMTAIYALDSRHKLHLSAPLADEVSGVVKASKLEKFVTRSFRMHGMQFIILHGIAEYTARQLREQRPLRHPHLWDEGSNNYTFDVTGRFHEWELVRKAQRYGKVREWQVDDMPYLIHQAAMLQSFIRYHMAVFLASFQSIWPDEFALSKLLLTQARPRRAMPSSWLSTPIKGKNTKEAIHRARVLIYISWVREQLSHLQRFDEQIVAFRDSTHKGDRYNDYEVTEFIKAICKLLDDVEPMIDREELHDETLRTLDTSGLMIPRRPKIPVVSEWEEILSSYRSLDQAHFYVSRYRI